MKTKQARSKPGVTTSTVLEKSWEGLPGNILLFPVSIALSGKMVSDREQTLALGAGERAEHLVEFRTRLLADIMEDKPQMIPVAAVTEALETKQDAAKEAYIAAHKSDATELPLEEFEAYLEEQAKAESYKVRLTEEEVEALKTDLPGWEDLTFGADSLKDAVTIYFNQKDERGRQPYLLLVEDIIREFWAWATPRPTISVSAFLQKQ